MSDATDQDSFEFYMCTVEESDGVDYPASVRFSHRAGELAPDPSRPHRVDVSVALLQPTDVGLTTNAEAEQLWALEDLLVAAAEPLGAVLVGVLTAKARREWFFHTSDGPALAAAFRTTLEQQADQGDRDVRLEGYVDPEWRYFRGALWPNDLAWRFVMDMRVVGALAERGDDGSAPRVVDHFAYFPDAASRSAFVEHLRGREFVEIEESLREPDESEADDVEQRFAVSFKREDRPRSIMLVTEGLAIAADELGGRYDGWGCPVVQSDES